LGYPTSDMVLDLKVNHSITKVYPFTRGSTLWLGLTAIWRGFELYECLLVVNVVALH